MRIQRWVMVVVVVALAACGKKDDSKAASPTPVEQPKVVDKPKDPTPAAPDHTKLIARGAYVANMASCLVCHTGAGPTGPDLANPGAGGLEIADPVAGTWRSPNITPDKATGIGNWTDDQILRAIREGTRPDGSQLFSIMPFTMYNRMTDDDGKALVAFLRTLKPVERVVAVNKNLKMPQLTLPAPTNAPDDKADPVKHGEYVATLMGCAHCHQTIGKEGPSPEKMFSGGLELTIAAFGTGKLFAPNITSDPETGIGKYTEDQIFTTVRTMVRPDGRMIAPPMLLMQGAWSQLDETDLRAMAKFIKQLPPVKNKVTPSTFKMVMPGGPPPAGSAAPTGSATTK